MFKDTLGVLIGFVIAPIIAVAMGLILIIGCIDEIGRFFKDKFELVG